jgi:hypothetical protein
MVIHTTAVVTMDMASTVMAVGIVGSTATRDSTVDTAEATNFTAVTASMAEARSAVAAASTVVAEVMEADTGNRGLFA